MVSGRDDSGLLMWCAIRHLLVVGRDLNHLSLPVGMHGLGSIITHF